MLYKRLDYCISCFWHLFCGNQIVRKIDYYILDCTFPTSETKVTVKFFSSGFLKNLTLILGDKKSVWYLKFAF